MRLPTVFIGHGSPMIALEDSSITRNFKRVGDRIIKEYQKPKGIVSISAHWFSRGNFTQSAEHPKQIYDMYGFDEALYQVRYDAVGDQVLSQKICALLEEDHIAINDDWGIDHGTWTVLTHMFPQADIPVVQLSVNGEATAEEVFNMGKKLASLRDEDYLILGSGNIVHNLRAVDWHAQGGSEENKAFDTFIVNHIQSGDIQKVLDYRRHPNAAYAVPTVDHFYPLLYILGASVGDTAEIFNQEGQLGAISMTSMLFSPAE